MNDWISVEDRLPVPDQIILFVCERHNEICVGYRSDTSYTLWYDLLNTDADGDPNDEYGITHWMPLPEPPDSAHGVIPSLFCITAESVNRSRQTLKPGGGMVDELTLTYDGSEKSKELLIQMANTSLGMNQGPVTLEITSVCEKQRTLKQNGSLHKWLDMLCKVLNDAGLEQRKVLSDMKEGFDLPWTKVSAKEWLYRPYMKAMTQKESTTELDTVEPSDICKVVGRNLAERYGITPPDWPSLENQRTRTGVFKTCHCDGLHHPHRSGSDVFCINHPHGPTDSDFEARYG